MLQAIAAAKKKNDRIDARKIFDWWEVAGRVVGKREVDFPPRRVAVQLRGGSSLGAIATMSRMATVLRFWISMAF